MATWRCFRLFQFLRIAGALIFSIFWRRPLRTSWLIVGTETRPFLSVVSVRWAVRRAGQSGDGATWRPGPPKTSGRSPLGFARAHAERDPFGPLARSVPAAGSEC